jgi:hypothetical protein
MSRIRIIFVSTLLLAIALTQPVAAAETTADGMTMTTTDSTDAMTTESMDDAATTTMGDDEQPDATSGSGPGFGVIAVLAAVGTLVALLVVRRR